GRGEAAEPRRVGDAAAHDAGAQYRDVLEAQARPPNRFTSFHVMGNTAAASTALNTSPGMNGSRPLASSESAGTNLDSWPKPRPKMTTLPAIMVKNMRSGVRSSACSASAPVMAAANGNAIR